MTTNQKIFNFNHISKNLPDGKNKEIKDCINIITKNFGVIKNHFNITKKCTNLTSASLVATGTIIGAITLNPINLASISVPGLLLQTYSTAKKYGKKVESSRFAYSSYNNILIELRDSLWSGVFDEKLFFNKSVVIDIINDNCFSIPYKMIKKYI